MTQKNDNETVQKPIRLRPEEEVTYRTSTSRKSMAVILYLSPFILQRRDRFYTRDDPGRLETYTLGFDLLLQRS